MIVVDSSVWISVLRSKTSPEAAILTSLLDHDEVALAVPVKLEVLSGVKAADLPRLRKALSALPLLYPTDDTWRLIDRWFDKTSKAGQRFGLGDLLVAALAHEQHALVWSLDADFKRLEKLGLVQLYA